MKIESVAIIGAGPAGLTAALAASQCGLDVTVFEQAPQFDPVGGGILLHSNGLRVLEALSLLDRFRPLMRLIETMTLEAGGRVLFRLDYRTLAVPLPHGAVIMRHALEECLLAAVREAAVPVHFGHRLEAVDLKTGRARLALSTPTPPCHPEFDVVIACDGVNSRTREALGVPVRPFTGEAFLRGTGLVEMPPTLREIWASGGRVFGICPLPGAQTHFYCSAPPGPWPGAVLDDLGAWLDTWDEFGPEVAAIVRAVPDWRQVNYSVAGEVRLRHWSVPPVFFVGDAAHAMRPNLGQGANAAMVDALVLVRLLAAARKNAADLRSVGRAYERVRRLFAGETQLVARTIGVFAGWQSRPGRWARDVLLSLPQRVPVLQHFGALLTAGYNPRETPWLAGGGGEALIKGLPRPGREYGCQEPPMGQSKETHQ